MLSMPAAWIRTTALKTYCLKAEATTFLSCCSYVALDKGSSLLSTLLSKKELSFMSMTF